MDLQFARRTAQKRARTELTAKNRFFQIGPQCRRAPLRTNSSTARRDLALKKSELRLKNRSRGFPGSSFTADPDAQQIHKRNFDPAALPH